jgi:antirestriction protein ArdC
MTDQLTNAHDRIAEAVERLVTGNDWKAMLDVAARFHTYSPNNLWLILAQRPDATRVAGFRAWRILGRCVRKGEHGIAVLAPIVTRTKPIDTNDERDRPELVKVLRGFKVVHVFDISQTDGTELPDVTPVLLTGEAPIAAWDMLAAHITKAGFTLERGDCNGANGYTSQTTRTVRVRDDVDDSQAVKTLAHELGHVLLHDNTDRTSDDRPRMEIEAESVAYLVCHQLGIISDDYSFAYLARWSNGDTTLIRATAERAITCAHRILTSSQRTDAAQVA